MSNPGSVRNEKLELPPKRRECEGPPSRAALRCYGRAASYGVTVKVTTTWVMPGVTLDVIWASEW